MKQTKMKLLVLLMLSIFAVMSAVPSLVTAGPSQFEVLIKVNDQGFFDSTGKAINEPLKVPKDRNTKLIFEHVGKSGEEHQFVLLFDSEEEISSGKISDLNRRASIEFYTGEEGKSYDVFCVIVDCDGMEHLMDLILIST